uniref:Uncharacterized protein n=1 Tax=Tanacetum cinerariifolium TaxID=118510 RepID=A0A699GSX1_TANCI|nr:hypothetical protein [Tanacetum cinerariifolium]
MFNNLQIRQQHKRVLTTRPACHSSLSSCLASLRESLSSVPDAYDQSLEALPSQSTTSGSESHAPSAVSDKEYPAAVAMSDVLGSGTHVHTPAHCGSEAYNELSDSILSNKPKPLGKHKPPPPQSVWSPNGLSYPP